MAVSRTDLVLFLNDLCSANNSANAKFVTIEVITVITCNIALCFVGTVANALIIMAYCRNRRLRTLQNFIFVVLAFTDITVTALVQPMYITYDITRLIPGTCSYLVIAVTVLSSFCSILLSLSTILVLSVLNFVTLAYPYRHGTIVTKYRVKATLISLWLIVLMLLMFSILVTRKIVHYGIACTAVLTMSIVLFTWIWTVKLIRRHRNAIREAQPSSLRQVTDRKRVVRSTVTAFFVVSSLFICYLPPVCFFVYFSVARVSMTVGDIWFQVALTMTFANSVFNPFLLFWRCSSFRETVANFC
jgi:hypothetical protein